MKEPYKISKAQYDQLPEWHGPLSRKKHGWPAALRLLDGNGFLSDLIDVAIACIKNGQFALARELLMPSDGPPRQIRYLPYTTLVGKKLHFLWSI